MSVGHADHHVKPASLYYVTFAKLAVLMVLTIAAARAPFMTADNPFWQKPIASYAMNFVALGIAITKAYLVVSIFMGVKFGSQLVKLFALLGFAWVLFMSGLAIDYGTRKWEAVKGWDSNKPTAFPRSETFDKREYEEIGPQEAPPTFR